MTTREYFEHLDASIEASISVLLKVSLEFIIVLAIVPLQILYLSFRCAFPFLNPFIDRFLLTDDEE